MANMGLLQNLRHFAESLYVTLRSQARETVGVRVVIYCARSDQLYAVLMQMRHELDPMDVTSPPTLHGDRSMMWNGIRIELREEAGR